MKHFNRVAEAEGVTVDPDAMALIARAADGSARDGLSLLDQAMALGGDRLALSRSATCWGWPTGHAWSICSKPP